MTSFVFKSALVSFNCWGGSHIHGIYRLLLLILNLKFSDDFWWPHKPSCIIGKIGGFPNAVNVSGLA